MMKAKRVGLAALLLAQPGFVTAADIPFHIQVTIYAKPCKVNQDTPQTVNFGRVFIDDIQKGKVEKDVPFVIDCGADAPPEVALWIQSTASTFNLDLLATDRPGLGIGIEDDKGNRYRPHVSHTLTYPFLNTMKAVLYPDPAAPPSEGAFSATATFQVTYN